VSLAPLEAKVSIKKTKIVLDFDSDSLKELRKVLFKRGLTPQQFLTYVVELVSLRDDRVSQFMDEALTHKQTNSGRHRANQHDAELLYKLIEDRLKENNKNGV